MSSNGCVFMPVIITMMSGVIIVPGAMVMMMVVIVPCLGVVEHAGESRARWNVRVMVPEGCRELDNQCRKPHKR
ncbi:MAG: hypothetical protein RIC14_00865 [Filomicrobium sp.]